MAGPLGLRRIDHVAVGVRDAAAATGLYIDRLGGRFVAGGDNDDTGNRIVHVALGGFKIEILQPLRPDCLLARTIDRRGEGIHHVTFLVEDLDAAVEALDEGGVPVVGTDLSNPVWRETFIRPVVAGGALIQLVTTTKDWSRPIDGIRLKDVLAGRVAFRDAWPCWREGRQTLANVPERV